jgi:proton-dependent oligopeptide transporter, POT family
MASPQLPRTRPSWRYPRDSWLESIDEKVSLVATDAAAIAASARFTNGRDLLGLPRGLFFIGCTEFWERISFHGMLALLVLYMVEQLLLPGHVEHIVGFQGLRAAIEEVTGPLSPQALASQIFGLYIGFVYLMPVFGGLLGDRVLGRRRAVALGALLMTAGHFCMAFEASFLVALLLLIVGAGVLRGNLASQVGDLYSSDDHRRETAFQIYYGALNTGAFIAPLITGVLAQTHGWHYGFGFAGVGMLVGLVVYLSGGQDLPPDAVRGAKVVRRKLSAKERRVVLVMMLMLPLLSLFWVAQTQIWNTYNLWVRDNVDLAIGSWKMPVPWLQSVDSLGVVVLVLPMLRFWRWQAARSSEPDDVTKLAIGCLLFGIAVAWLAGGQLVADETGKVPLVWALVYHFLSAVGYLYFAPVAVAVFSRTAPASVNAMMIGIYYLSIFAGSIISGRLGGLYERLSSAQFWLIHAAVVTAGGLLILVFSSRLRRELTSCPD